MKASAVLAKRLAYAGVLGALLVMVQVALAGLPNIELVSVLVMVASLYDRKMARAAIAAFVMVEGLIYGFHLWWIAYLYVWYVLHAVTLATKAYAGPLFSAILCGLFGLGFGTLCAIPYFVTAGVSGGAAYILAGIPFDIVHCIGNFATTLVLFRPLQMLFDKLPPLQAKPPMAANKPMQ